jgi:hypothetical protein
VSKYHISPVATMTTTPQKITFGEMRASCVRDVLIYCRDEQHPSESDMRVQ